MTETLERQLVPPREGLRRTSPFLLRDAATDGTDAGDGLTLDGYAAVFNRQTTIDSWEGRFKEEIAPGAMKKSFRENPPRVQFDHGSHPLIGSIPIAAIESIREEVDPVLAPDGGAHVVARMLDNWLVQPVRDAIANRSIDGMSFRFSVVREAWRTFDGKRITDQAALMDLLRQTWVSDFPEEELPVRTLQELRVPELGPVVWPAYTETSVGVRSAGTVTIDLARLHEPDQRTKLAQAVLAADRAEQSEQSPQPTAPAAGEHDQRSDEDTPPITEPSAPAETHESASASRDALRRYLSKTHHTLTQIDLQEGRYSS